MSAWACVVVMSLAVVEEREGFHRQKIGLDSEGSRSHEEPDDPGMAFVTCLVERGDAVVVARFGVCIHRQKQLHCTSMTRVACQVQCGVSIHGDRVHHGTMAQELSRDAGRPVIVTACNGVVQCG